MNTAAPGPGSTGEGVTPLVAVGATLGVAMTSLSVVGLLGRLTGASVIACLLVSLAAGAACRRLGTLRPARTIWLALPLFALPALAAALLPPFTWDEVAYGAALPRDFARAGRLFYNADYGAYAAFPGNYEALVTASLLLTRDVRPAQVLNVALAAGLAAIATLLARLLRVSRMASLLAGLFVACAPALVQVAAVAKNDTANAFFQALAVVTLASLAGRRWYAAAALSGAFLGVSLGIKYGSLHFVAAVTPFALILLAGSAPSRTDAIRQVSLWLAALVIFTAPWYLRNLLLFGNPLFPFLNDTFGARNGFTPEHSALLRESFDGLSDFSLRTGTPSVFVARVVDGFGILPVALSAAGALLALQPPRRPLGLFVAGTAVVYAALTLFAGYWAPRYFLSLLVLASALAALALDQVAALVLRLRPAWRALPGVVLLACATWAVRGGVPAWSDHWRNVTELRRDGRTAFLERHVGYFAVARWLNAHLAYDDRVAIGFNVQPFYYLERSYYHIHPLTEGHLVAAQSPDEVEAALREVGVTVLAFSREDGTYVESTAPKICAYRTRLFLAMRRLKWAGRLRTLATVDGVTILRFVDAPAPAVGR